MWTPREAFLLAFPNEEVRDGDLAVMSWVLPQTEATLRDQRQKRELTAERWARSRIFGEEHVNSGLRRHLVAALAAQGVQAVAPFLLPEWRRISPEASRIASTWSERHAAYAAGLGTFGLCDGLITPKGKAMRVGSVILRLAVRTDTRPYTDHREYCLFFNSGTCGVCIARCPAKALSPEGHDKAACYAYLQGETRPYVENTWHFKGYGCGLCQVAVPCERRIPPRPGRNSP